MGKLEADKLRRDLEGRLRAQQIEIERLKEALAAASVAAADLERSLIALDRTDSPAERSSLPFNRFTHHDTRDAPPPKGGYFDFDF